MPENIEIKEMPLPNWQTTRHGHELKILVAEDNPVVLKGLLNFLHKWGYQPMAATTGDETWRLLEEDHEIRMAILDWNLPGMSGIQICQKLRIRLHGPYVYTIIFSARSSAEEQVMALDGGADDYLAKPAKPSILRARLGAGRRIIDTALKLAGNHAEVPK
jgi:eukaryotic-like serine/threonine-protein kinase